MIRTSIRLLAAVVYLRHRLMLRRGLNGRRRLLFFLLVFFLIFVRATRTGAEDRRQNQ